MTPKIIIRALILFLISGKILAQNVVIPNPILFVTQVPMPADSNTVTSVFCNHQGDMYSVVRGGDLYILYPDGTLKNLTKAAGFGMDGFQGANAIAVRDPSVHWSGNKALFSMIIGAPVLQSQPQQYRWQIYEVTKFGKGETPVITKIPNQPLEYNNISPFYGTDDRIIFTSDRPHNGQAQLYPLLDERFSFPSTTGIWSLSPGGADDLFQLNSSPSGSFTPFIDSYGRIIFTRWDHLQRDGNSDFEALGSPIHYKTFNYSDESANAIETNSNEEIFPEPESFRHDQLKGTNLNGLTFNQFFPWQINEDGTSEETLNHIGRQDILPAFLCSINDDSNVTNFDFLSSHRLNDSVILGNILHVCEDPVKPGTYYATAFLGNTNLEQHSSGQIITFSGSPLLDPGVMRFTYITDKSTALPTFRGKPTDSNNTGHYRNPVPISNGKLLVVHAPEVYLDTNLGTASHPISRYDFRIKSMRKSGNLWVADTLLTTGISKSVSYWDPDTLASYSGPLWEFDPVEVRARQKPPRPNSNLATPEKKIFIEEGIDETAFHDYMKQNSLGMIVSRNVTHRDKNDHQQPYYLKVHNSITQSANSHGKIYDIAHLQIYQADQIRGLKVGYPNPIPGRRVLPELMHDSAVLFNPAMPGEKPSSTKIASDGSFASFVPSRRALTWALTDTAFNAVVRERYWVTTQPGEIRVCASCHGTNDEALVHLDPPPQNKPEALRSLLQYWKSSHMPLSPELVSPPTDSVNIAIAATLVWNKVNDAKTYQVTTSTTSDFSQILFTSAQLTDTTFIYNTNKINTTFYWRVQAFSDAGATAYSGIWNFTTAASSTVPKIESHAGLSLSNHPNPFSQATTIDFNLVNSEAVKLKIFNILGQEIATIAEGFFESGKHSVYWDVENLPSGAYYSLLQYGGGIATRAMRIIRP